MVFFCQVPILENTYLLQSVAFSQSGKYIYVSSEGADEGGVNKLSKIWQFDLAGSGNCTEFAESKQLVYKEPELYYGWDIGDMLLERNTGRIYFSIIKRFLEPGDDTIKGEQNLHLHAILEPDLAGALSNVQENVLYLGGFVARSGLPNMPNYGLGALQGSPCDTLDTANSVIEALQSDFQVYPNPVFEYIFINNPFTTACEAMVYNVTGQEVARLVLYPGLQTLNTQNWPTGIYQVVIHKQNEIVWRQTLVKSY
jgi:hypothetical protein